MKLIESVPNFSEGRNPQVINNIAAALQSVPGVRLLHCDSGWDAHRTVMTLIGKPEPLLESLFRGITVATHEIDLRQHHGIHPRIGATDVVPFVPWQESTLTECGLLANRLAQRLAQDLKIPTYLYGAAASDLQRQDLTLIRRRAGKEWEPDYGPRQFPLKSGATAIGARPILLAYNVTLVGTDAQIAKTIAGKIRESGMNGNPGLFKQVKAIGWYLDEYQRPQVSMNIAAPEQTPLHEIFEAIKGLAMQLGCRVTGSQLIGMISKDILLGIGAAYSPAAANDSELMNAAVAKLGLNELAPFRLEERVIELALSKMPIE